MDSTRRLKECCGIWHQDVSSRSFKSCKLISRESGNHEVSTGTFLSCFSNYSWACFLQYGRAHCPVERGHCYRGIPLSWRRILYVITMNARTQRLPLSAWLLPFVHPIVMWERHTYTHTQLHIQMIHHLKKSWYIKSSSIAPWFTADAHMSFVGPFSSGQRVTMGLLAGLWPHSLIYIELQYTDTFYLLYSLSPDTISS